MAEHSIPGHWPDPSVLSAWLDGELDAAQQQRLADHLTLCPVCAAHLADMQALSADFAALPRECLGYDLAGVIEGRIAASRPSTRRTESSGWKLWPIAAGAVASLAAGIFMGSVLVSAGGAATPRVTALHVFDSMPPGNLCIGFESCYRKGSLQ